MEKRMKSKIILLTLVLALLVVPLSGCGIFEGEVSETQITASGTISADRISIAPQIGGEIVEIMVKEGESVEANQELFRLDDEILRAQYNQAQAAVDQAEAGIKAAETQLVAAELQYERARQGARLMYLQRLQGQTPLWSQGVPDEFNQPNWYYQREEDLTGAEKEVEKAERTLEIEQANLESIQKKASNDDFIAVELTLAEARARFRVADQTLTQAQFAEDNEILEEMAQKDYDAALADLETAQRDYDRMITSAAASEVLEARAKVAVATARMDNAHNYLDSLLTLDQSLDVQAAKAVVESARSQIDLAETGKDQALAALSLLQIQLDKSIVTAPISGTVITRNGQVGELTGAGSSVISLAKLDLVNLTVYIPEDVYGRIPVGQRVSITVDSYPGETFYGEVIRIADQAEFTPRNVQTVEGRKATVYAVEIEIPNGSLKLKPGMPADVNFGINRP
ncbi:MAG TPA: efflux RND transporter periplasmic adaptor subunit [Anaerolineaceae bacterium]|nr:efflux RND transporter periplasmic adaptor subunit [Anaerolineaceae bacterium]